MTEYGYVVASMAVLAVQCRMDGVKQFQCGCVFFDEEGSGIAMTRISD